MATLFKIGFKHPMRGIHLWRLRIGCVLLSIRNGGDPAFKNSHIKYFA